MRALALLSGGLDSPVAAHLMMERGASVSLLTMDNHPYADKSAVDKVIRIASRLKELHDSTDGITIMPFGSTAQRAIHESCDPHYQCVLCKRFMYRVASAIAEEGGHDVLLTGDSLGQVASQTLRNLKVMSASISVPVIRPLIGLDKTEIVEVSKAQGLYELSIINAVGCTLAPSKPKTMADPEKVEREESRLDIDAIVTACIKGKRIVAL